MVRFRAVFFLLLTGTIATAAACGGAGTTTGGKPGVVATTQQIGSLARAIVGDRMTVTTLIGPGVDPHDYEASPNNVKSMGAAAIVLKHGIGLDAHLDKAIEGSGAKRVVTVTTGIVLLKSASGDNDPHVWHDPEDAKIMADNIEAALASVDPANADYYRQQADAQKQRLDAADTTIKQLIGAIPPDNRKMVTDHDAFAYFIKRYGLQFVGAVIPGVATQGEASAQQLATLEDLIRKDGVKAIFAENSLDPRVSQQIAKDTGVKIVTDLYGDSLGPPGSGADTIEGMLVSNATKIAGALK